ncbi:Glutamate decarboxylase beta [Caballeronia terrestris]|uniref:glutamate decarboxylase n=1 Tax=Caballeronia terrestris TaxID=1226301 RepID=A0A158L4L3_9BURK|nr:Glutamate decarboxylase beta [Caballeronia terrestris]
MLAGLAHKWNWRQAREKAGKDATRPNMVTGGNVQVVWKKFLRYFDVEPRIVPLKPGNYRLTAERLEQYVDENTIAVVAIAGQTFTGEDDDIQEIHDKAKSVCRVARSPAWRTGALSHYRVEGTTPLTQVG